MDTVEQILSEYNWIEAFRYADFDANEVASIIKWDEGENDGDSWLAVGTLKNGLFFFLSAWCDYTGWDCQSGGSSETADTLDNLIRWRMGDYDRQRLGFVLPDETDGAPLPLIAE